MASTEFYTGVAISVQYLWAYNSPYSTKWKKTTKRTASKIVGLENKSEADSAATVVAAYANVENVQETMDASGLWEVTFTIVEVEWENLGNYLGGVLQS